MKACYPGHTDWNTTLLLFDLLMRQSYPGGLGALFDKSQKKGSDRFSYPAEGGDVDAEVGCDMFQGDFLKDVRVFFDEELVPFRCCEGLELY